MKFGIARIVTNLMDKKILGMILGAVSLTSAIIWIVLEQGIGLSFEMLEP